VDHDVEHSVRCMSLLFFSSRRRHTRSKRDWSSDVCSSDLMERCNSPLPLTRKASVESVSSTRSETSRKSSRYSLSRKWRVVTNRSEERRVGKECRSRGERSHYKENRKKRVDGEKTYIQAEK